VASKHASIYWIEFGDQWDPKSPWPTSGCGWPSIYALNRKAINEVACPGLLPAGRVHRPRVMDFALQRAAAALRPARPNSSSPRRAIPKGIDAGEFVPTPPFFTVAEAA
jgi:hypothetical protein